MRPQSTMPAPEPNNFVFCPCFNPLRDFFCLKIIFLQINAMIQFEVEINRPTLFSFNPGSSSGIDRGIRWVLVGAKGRNNGWKKAKLLHKVSNWEHLPCAWDKNNTSTLSGPIIIIRFLIQHPLAGVVGLKGQATPFSCMRKNGHHCSCC